MLDIDCLFMWRAILAFRVYGKTVKKQLSMDFMVWFFTYGEESQIKSLLEMLRMPLQYCFPN